MSLPAPTTSHLPATLSVSVAAATAVGGRPTNQDAVVAVDLPPMGGEPAFLMAVADGMGGAAGGDVASSIAVRTLQDAVAGDTGADAALLLKQAFRKANEAIWSEAGGNGMGTTLTAALVRGKYVAIASVGDSRAYLLRGPGVTQVTKDHSLVAEQVAQGAIRPEEARSHPQRNVLTQSLGTKPKLDKDLPPVYELALLPDDRLLLCSDGFYDVLENRDIADLLRGAEPAAAANALVALATERGTTDNVSAVVAAAAPTRVVTAMPVPAEAPHRNLAAVAVAAIVVLVIAALVAAWMLGLLG